MSQKNIFEKHPKKTLFIIIIVLLTFMVLGVELFLSLTKSDEKKNDFIRYIRLREQNPSTVRYNIPDRKYMSRVDSLIQKKYRLEIDKDGFIFPSRVHETPDVTLIFLGGSSTECMYVDEDSRFPYLVGRLLEKDARKVNSFNSGVSGNNSMHSINILLNKGLELKPDIAVMMHNINDLISLMYDGNYWSSNPSRSLLLVIKNESFMTKAKNIFRAAVPKIYEKVDELKYKMRPPEATDEFAHVRGKSLTFDKQDLKKKFERNLSAFINICRSYGIIPVLMTQSNRFKASPDNMIRDAFTLEEHFGIPYDEFRDLYDSFNDVIRHVGKSHNVLLIDLAKDIPQDKQYMYDCVHFNDYGSRHAAQIIAGRLQKLIPSAGKAHESRDVLSPAS